MEHLSFHQTIIKRLSFTFYVYIRCESNHYIDYTYYRQYTKPICRRHAALCFKRVICRERHIICRLTIYLVYSYIRRMNSVDGEGARKKKRGKTGLRIPGCSWNQTRNIYPVIWLGNCQHEVIIYIWSDVIVVCWPHSRAPWLCNPKWLPIIAIHSHHNNLLRDCANL